MRKLHLLFLLLLSAAVIGSCRKKNEIISTPYLLTGTWTLTQAGIDLNKNSIVDDGEVAALPDASTSVTFHPGGSGSGQVKFGHFDVNSDFNWGYEESGKILWIAKEADTARLMVRQVDYSSLVLLNQTVTVYGNNTWQIFVKN